MWENSKNSKKYNFTGLEIVTNTVTNATNIFSKWQPKILV